MVDLGVRNGRFVRTRFVREGDVFLSVQVCKEHGRKRNDSGKRSVSVEKALFVELEHVFVERALDVQRPSARYLDAPIRCASGVDNGTVNVVEIFQKLESESRVLASADGNEISAKLILRCGLGKTVTREHKLHKIILGANDPVYVEKFAKPVVVELFPPRYRLVVKMSTFHVDFFRATRFPIADELNESERENELFHRFIDHCIGFFRDDVSRCKRA